MDFPLLVSVSSELEGKDICRGGGGGGRRDDILYLRVEKI